MKSVFVVSIILFSINISLAQSDKNKLLFDINLLRYSPTVGSFQYYTKLRATTLNYIKIGYLLHNEDNIKFGFGRINEGYIIQYDYARINYYGSGNEYSIGFEKKIKLNNHFNFFIESGPYFEYLKETGDYWSDSDSLTNEINHIRKGCGGYLELKFAYNITNNIAAFYSLRNRLGFYRATGVLTQDPKYYSLAPQFKGISNYFEALNLGVRIRI